MSKSYTIPHEVTYYECDINSNMTISSLLAAAILVSEKQSDALGRGSDFVHQLGLGWVITNYQVHIARLPKTGEIVEFTTQATAYNKYFCYRNFWVHSQAGEELVKIESVFVLMDQTTRKLSHVREEVIEPYECEKITKIRRAPAIEKIEQGKTIPYRVRFYDIDGNQHVNNAVYFNWMLDALGYDFLKGNIPEEINIRFDKEIEYGNEVDSCVEIISDESVVKTRHEIRVGGKLCSEANILWKSFEV